MGQVNEKLDSLLGRGFNGSLQDMERDWLLSVVTTPNGVTINDLWYRYMVEQGEAPTHLNDMFFTWLRGQGFTGSLNDMWLDYWDFFPNDFPNLIQWNRFNQGITVTGSGVSQWDDQSGQGNHYLQGVDANRMTLQGNGALLGNGVDQFIKTAGYTLPQPATVFLRFKQLSWVANDRVFDGAIQTVLAQVGSSPQLQIFAGVGFVPMSPSLPLNTLGTVVIVFNGAASQIQLENNAPTVGDAGVQVLNGTTLGATASGTQNSNIEVWEQVIYSDVKTQTEIQRVVNYLNSL